jgi:hypothetical protein
VALFVSSARSRFCSSGKMTRISLESCSAIRALALRSNWLNSSPVYLSPGHLACSRELCKSKSFCEKDMLTAAHDAWKLTPLPPSNSSHLASFYPMSRYVSTSKRGKTMNRLHRGVSAHNTISLQVGGKGFLLFRFVGFALVLHCKEELFLHNEILMRHMPPQWPDPVSWD